LRRSTGPIDTPSTHFSEDRTVIYEKPARLRAAAVIAGLCLLSGALPLGAQKYSAASGRLRVALAKQPLSPNGQSKGPSTMAEGGIQKILADMGADVRIQEARLTSEEEKEYGGWKRLGMALGHFSDLVAQNEREGYFTVGLLATCPSISGCQGPRVPGTRVPRARCQSAKVPAMREPSHLALWHPGTLAP
jgi:hypothetical protein